MPSKPAYGAGVDEAAWEAPGDALGEPAAEAGVAVGVGAGVGIGPLAGGNRTGIGSP